MAGFFKKLFGGGEEEAAPVPEQPPLDADAEIDLVFARAEEELDLKTEIAASTWGLGSGASWDADLEAGTIRFVNDKGWQITAPVQVVGSLNTADGTWLWGWDHPSVAEPISQHAQLVREFGAKHGLEALTTRMIEAGEEDGWTFTALACHLAGAQGGYRGPSGTTMIFMTFGEVTIQQA